MGLTQITLLKETTRRLPAAVPSHQETSRGACQCLPSQLWMDWTPRKPVWCRQQRYAELSFAGCHASSSERFCVTTQISLLVIYGTQHLEQSIAFISATECLLFLRVILFHYRRLKILHMARLEVRDVSMV